MSPEDVRRRLAQGANAMRVWRDQSGLAARANATAMSHTQLWALTFGVSPARTLLIYRLITELHLSVADGKPFDAFEVTRDAIKARYLAMPGARA